MFSKKLSVLMFCALLAGCASDEAGDTTPTTPPPANEPEPSGPGVPDQVSALLDPTALCAIPTLGPALVSGAGSSCDDAGGGGGGSGGGGAVRHLGTHRVVCPEGGGLDVVVDARPAPGGGLDAAREVEREHVEVQRHLVAVRPGAVHRVRRHAPDSARGAGPPG